MVDLLQTIDFICNLLSKHIHLWTLRSSAAHECNIMERNQQYDHICQTIFTRPMGFCSGCKDSKSTTIDGPHCKVRLAGNFVEDSDFVIWLGDLNYRVEMPRNSVGLLLSHNLEEVFRTYDLYVIHSYTCAKWI